jgi:hypothetical protein
MTSSSEAKLSDGSQSQATRSSTFARHVLPMHLRQLTSGTSSTFASTDTDGPIDRLSDDLSSTHHDHRSSRKQTLMHLPNPPSSVSTATTMRKIATGSDKVSRTFNAWDASGALHLVRKERTLTSCGSEATGDMSTTGLSNMSRNLLPTPTSKIGPAVSNCYFKFIDWHTDEYGSSQRQKKAQNSQAAR